MKIDVCRVGRIGFITPRPQAIISIKTPRIKYKGVSAWIKENFRYALELRFSDVEEERPGVRSFSAEDAYRVVEFIAGLHATGADVLIHCDAGVSRSVAVAMFMRDYHSGVVKLHDTWNDQLRNNLVYRRLQEANERHRLAWGLEAVDPMATPSRPTSLEWEESMLAKANFLTDQADDYHIKRAIERG